MAQKKKKSRSPKRSRKISKTSKTSKTSKKSTKVIRTLDDIPEQLKKGMKITDTLLAKYLENKREGKYYHISKKRRSKQELKSVGQPLIMGFNCTGRPSGFYFGVDNSWMHFILRYREALPFCCFMYEVDIDESSLLKLDSLKKLDDFDKKIPDYWLGWENYDLCHSVTRLDPSRKVYFGKLLDKYRDTKLSMGDIYLKEKIIYGNAKDYVKNEGPTRYKTQLELNRFKRWDVVAKKYDGILINPYFYDKEFTKKRKMMWYGSFDAVQGIIWNVRAIKGIKLKAHKVDIDVLTREYIFEIDENF